MNPAKCSEHDYINFLVAAQQVYWSLTIPDTTVDKPYASKMALVSRHWSGKQHEVVQGINLISLVWSDGDACCLATTVCITRDRMA